MYPKRFILYDDTRLKWSRDLKLDLIRGKHGSFEESKIRDVLYRPFCRKYLFFDRVFNEEVYVFPRFFPNRTSETENVVITVSGPGNDCFYCLIANRIVELKFSNSTNGGTQCFPFYTYEED